MKKNIIYGLSIGVALFILIISIIIIKIVVKPTPPTPPTPPSPPGCSNVSSRDTCPKIPPPSTPRWPPALDAKLPKCSATSGYPCIDETIPISPKNPENIYKGCFPKNSSNVDNCPTDTKCIRQNKWYGQCRPICNESIPNSCCTPADRCNSCQNMPLDGLCKNNTFSIGTIWLKYKFNDKICCYRGGDRNFYYDNGAACNELMCTQSNGHWKDRSSCKFNTNIIKLTYSLDDYFTKQNNYYSLTKELILDSNVDCNSVNQLIDSNNIQYVLVSAKPINWYCPQFKKWEENNDCSINYCIQNCNSYKDYLKSKKVDKVDDLYNCNELCNPVDLQDVNLKVKASTTDFGFGSATSCMCDGKELMKDLSGENTGTPFSSKGNGNSDPKLSGAGYWVGVATPSWIQSPFNTNKTSGTSLGGSTIASRFGQEYTSNCSSGNGGCGTCWNLTRQDLPSQSINAVVIDTCEDANAYGNNYNWCIAQRPDTQNWVPNPNGAYSGNWPPFFKQLPLTSTTDVINDKIPWKADECFDSNGKFICKNMDFHPVHFDVAIQQIPKKALSKMGIWPESTNPKVIAQRIQCPDDLKQKVITKHCGKNANSSVTTDEYCPGHDNTTFWSTSNPDGWWPSN